MQDISLDEKTFTGSLDIANCFNKFFTSVGSRLRSLLPTLNVSSYCDRLILTPRDTPDFVFKDIPVSFVWKELSSLCVNKSSGLKDIHSRILKVGSNVLAAPLTHIFNLSILCGEIPRSWKAATVTPLHKSGSHCDPIILDRFWYYHTTDVCFQTQCNYYSNGQDSYKWLHFSIFSRHLVSQSEIDI